MNRWISIVFTIFFAFTLVLLVNKYYPAYINNDQSKLTFFISLVVLLSLLSRISISSLKFATFLKQVGGWIVIVFLIFAGYSFQYELKNFGNRMAATIIPGYGQNNPDGSVKYYAGSNNHFKIDGVINDFYKIKFLFDTGASMVSLTASDAKLIGIDVENLNYNVPLNTANGVSYGARVRLVKVQVGPIALENVEAVVSQEKASDVSLLGMSFLGRIKQFVIKGNTLTLVN